MHASVRVCACVHLYVCVRARVVMLMCGVCSNCYRTKRHRKKWTNYSIRTAATGDYNNRLRDCEISAVYV